MKSLMMYCLSLNNEDFEKIKTLGYEPVGLGDKYFSDNWIRDNEGENISYKNKYYGEYTFHYWFWKNKIKEIDDKTWIGFCAYRRFWSQKINKIEISNKEDFLSTIPNEWKNYETILGQQIYMDAISDIEKLELEIRSSFELNPAMMIG